MRAGTRNQAKSQAAPGSWRSRRSRHIGPDRLRGEPEQQQQTRSVPLCVLTGQAMAGERLDSAPRNGLNNRRWLTIECAHDHGLHAGSKSAGSPEHMDMPLGDEDSPK